jgi:hypothetical protein
MFRLQPGLGQVRLPPGTPRSGFVAAIRPDRSFADLPQNAGSMAVEPARQFVDDQFQGEMLSADRLVQTFSAHDA